MPSTDQIKKAQDRRAARAGKKADNQQAAIDQEHELAALSDRLRGVDGRSSEQMTRDTEQHIAEREPIAKPVGTRAQQRVAIQAAAEKQAEADLQATVNPLEDEDPHNLAYYRNNNIDPPLHVLNAIARRSDNAFKDDARVAAQAAGKAAYEALTDHRTNRSPESRHKTMEKSMADARNAKAAAEKK